jgi:hypothetical protein
MLLSPFEISYFKEMEFGIFRIISFNILMGYSKGIMRK